VNGGGLCSSYQLGTATTTSRAKENMFSLTRLRLARSARLFKLCISLYALCQKRQHLNRQQIRLQEHVMLL
jgi:hypothetical protein